MSSKVVTGSTAAGAEGLNWQDLGVGRDAPVALAGSPPAPALRPLAPLRSQALPEPPPAAVLEARIAQLELQVKEARLEGQREGEAAGFRKAAASLEPVFERFSQTVREIAGFRSRFRHEAEADLVKLSIAIARRILNREIQTDPEALLGLVKSALQKLDSRETYRLRVHPQDSAGLQAQLPRLGLPERFDLVADPSLERGAAVFETSHGSLDASIETQLNEIASGLADRLNRRSRE